MKFPRPDLLLISGANPEALVGGTSSHAPGFVVSRSLLKPEAASLGDVALVDVLVRQFRPK